MGAGAEAGHGGSHIEDPGKEARSASGIPIVPAFDGYRAFAILGVVMLHLITVSGVVGIPQDGLLARLTWGTFGRAVEVLFVVSGFVVFLPTVARGGDFGGWGSYGLRRGARLLPAYWLILVISLILLATVSLNPDVPFPGALSVFSHFTGLQMPVTMFSSDVTVGFFVNVPLWTLSIELGFYIVLPFIAAAYFRHPWVGLGIAAAITILWDVLFDHFADVADVVGYHPGFDTLFRIVINSGAQLPSWALSFAVGMTGAWVYVRVKTLAANGELEPDLLRRRIHMVVAGSVAATLVLAWINGGFYDQSRQSLWLSMAFTITLAAAMVAIALSSKAVQAPFANTPVRRLGDISYGIYLVHFLLIIYLGDLLNLPKDGTAADLAIWMLAVLPAAVLYGYLSARFLEQPIRRRARKFGRRESN